MSDTSHGNSKWDDEYYLEIYELLRAGMTDVKVAAQLGVTTQTLLSWKKTRPALMTIWAKARTAKDPDDSSTGPKSATLQDYVYQRLDPQYKGAWDEIMRLEEREADQTAWHTLRSMLDRGGKVMRQHLFMHALFHSLFNMSEACRLVCIEYEAVKSWMRTDPKFAQLLQDVRRIKGDFFEEKLVGLVKSGDSAATIFANRTYNRDRGYNDKVEVVHSNEVNANVITSEDLRGMAPDLLRSVLDHIRKRRSGQDALQEAEGQTALPEIRQNIQDAEVVRVHRTS